MRPTTSAGTLTALLLALAPSSAFAQVSDPVNPYAAPENPYAAPTNPYGGAQGSEVAPPEAGDGRMPRARTYSLGISLVESRFRSEVGDKMGMLGAGLTVNYTVGRRFGFGLRANITFPMHGRLSSNGESGGVNLIEMYDAQRLSFDSMFMVMYRLSPSDSLDFVFGAGVHVHTLRLVSSVYDPIEIIQGGLGGVARVERRLSSHFFMSGELAAAFDPLDFIRRDNRAVFVAPVALTFAVGARR